MFTIGWQWNNLKWAFKLARFKFWTRLGIFESWYICIICVVKQLEGANIRRGRLRIIILVDCRQTDVPLISPICQSMRKYYSEVENYLTFLCKATDPTAKSPFTVRIELFQPKKKKKNYMCASWLPIGSCSNTSCSVHGGREGLEIHCSLAVGLWKESCWDKCLWKFDTLLH